MQHPKISFETGQKVVHGKYMICHKIGEGQHSTIYSTTLKRRGEQMIRVIKVQNEHVKYPQINNQLTVLKSIEEIQGSDIGFTKFFQYGIEADYNYMIMELLGPNLEHLLKLTGGKFSLKTVLILGLQIVDRLQILHAAGWVYRDIHPSNFVMGLQNKSPIVHMIDFGKCKRYRNKQGMHIPYKQSAHFEGDLQFSSLNIHSKTEYSRRDDIESLIYMMIYLRKGKLPWSIAKELKTKKQRQSVVEQLKRKVQPEHLTFKMPLQFADMLTYVRTLNFYQKPDYDYIRILLHRSFDPQQDNLKLIYDWNKLDPLDFSIYSGIPKIVQINQPQQQKHNEIYQKKITRQQQKLKQQPQKLNYQTTLDNENFFDYNQADDRINIKQQANKQSNPFDFLKI